MKNALICPNEPAYSGWRIAQVEASDAIFPVADPCFWVVCSDEIEADKFYYDEAVKDIFAIPDLSPPIVQSTGTTSI